MDPTFLMWLAQNPEMGGMLDQAGVPVPQLGGSDLGAMMAKMQDPASWQTTVTPEAAAANPAAGRPNNPMAALAAMQGIKAPAPVTPIMSGGVAGGVKSPEVNAAGLKQGAPAIQAALAALLGGAGGAGGIPNLGAMIPRR